MKILLRNTTRLTGIIVCLCLLACSQAIASRQSVSVLPFLTSIAGEDQSDHRGGSEHIAMLYQDYPNPFNPTTRITYTLPERQFVRIDVCCLLGSTIATLVEREQSPGIHHVILDGRQLPSGIYFCRLATERGVLTKSMILLK